RWEYEGECLSPKNLGMLNITMQETQVASFNEAEVLLQQRLNEGSFVIVTCNVFDLPYKMLHYQETSIKHRFIYAGHKDTEDGLIHLVLDDNASAMRD